MSYQLDEDLLPECPFPGVSARYVWENLRELQLAYQDRHTGWQKIPAEFELLARALRTVVELEPIPTRPDAFERHPTGGGGVDATLVFGDAQASLGRR
ncbi:MAG: hypothetical protein M3304_05960 [Actinomycetota bacterium]|nr:hypothetical protein [Actinomycetota bacterium]